MSKRARWLLVLLMGLQTHILLVIFAVVNLTSNRSLKATVIPFGQLNYRQVTNVATIEWLIIFILWIVFAVFLIRHASE
jgi:hypothetical protein